MEDKYLFVIIAMAVAFLLALTLLLVYVRHQQRAAKQQGQLLESKLARQVSLLHATIQSQEDERKRIGQELHDDVASMLANLRINIRRLADAAGGTVPAEASGQQCAQLIDKTISSVRSISGSLLPPGLELSGLAGALEALGGDITRSGAMEVIIENRHPQRLQELTRDRALMLFRVLQELLSNTMQHAGASRAFIYLNAEGQKLVIDYRDNGKGFEQDGQLSGMGMRIMESRLDMIGATYTMHGNAGTGMQMHICLNMQNTSTAI